MIVLASGSPRRAALLRAAGVSFRVIVPSVDESMLPGESGATAAERLSRLKAAAVDGKGDPVLAADTLVVCEDTVMGKPADDREAAEMLARLAGRAHAVVTGVCLATGTESRSALARTLVRFAPMTRSEIKAYVQTGEPGDRAGAYHIDGLASRFIESVEGSPSNVAGLPLHLVFRLAAALRISAALE